MLRPVLQRKSIWFTAEKQDPQNRDAPGRNAPAPDSLHAFEGCRRPDSRKSGYARLLKRITRARHEGCSSLHGRRPSATPDGRKKEREASMTNLSHVFRLLSSAQALLLASPLQAQQLWVQVPVSGPSPGRSYAAMAHDSVRRRMVLFGGRAGSAIHADTWEYDGTWTLRTPTTSPPLRWYHAMSYDSTRGVTVLFGGYGGGNRGSELGDIWEWDGTNWTQRTPPDPRPPNRASHALAYDSSRLRTVLFGGENINSPGLNDTWEWDGSAWLPSSPATPPPIRRGHALAYDAGRGVTVLFGGTVTNQSIYLGDTWEWNGTDWRDRSLGFPSPRFGHTMTYDNARGQVILFGGQEPVRVSETWEWNGITWTQRCGESPFATPCGPPPRDGPVLAFDSHRSRAVLTGGERPTPLTDTWELPACSLLAQTSGNCAGNLTVGVTSIPPAATHLWLWVDGTPANPIGSGQFFGLVFPDPLLMAFLSFPAGPCFPYPHFPLSTPCNPSFSFPTGTFSVLCGNVWDLTAILYTYGPPARIVCQTNISRIRW